MTWKRISASLKRLFTPNPRPNPRPTISYPIHIHSTAPIHHPHRTPTPYYTPAEERPCSEISMTCIGIDSLICSDTQPFSDLHSDTTNSPVPSSPSSLHPQKSPWFLPEEQQTRFSRFTVSDYARDSFVYTRPEPETEREKKRRRREQEVDSPTLPRGGWRETWDGDGDGESIGFRYSYYGALYDSWVAGQPGDGAFVMRGGGGGGEDIVVYYED